MKPEQLKEMVVSVLDDSKGNEIRVLDVRSRTSFTDFMVVASGTSDRQVQGLARQLLQKVKEKGIRPLGIEGERIGEWILVDLGEVVVHLMLSQVRDLYKLEELWS